MKLTLILDQKISQWIEKGELIDSYFNPKKVFNEILVINLVKDKSIDFKEMTKLCGTSKFLYIELNNFIFQSKMLQTFVPLFVYKKIIKIQVKKFKLFKTNLVMSVGDRFAGFVATQIAKIIKKRSVISIHSVVNLKLFLNNFSIKEKILFIINYRFLKNCHKNADLIRIVYRKIFNQINTKYISKTRCLYNIVPVKEENIKKNFSSQKNFNLVFVGRLIKGKSPELILRSIVNFRNVYLTIIGDGPLKTSLIKLSKELKISERVFFKSKIDNKNLLKLLKNYDIFISFDKYEEFPKTFIEALLIGLPIISNKKPLSNQQELKDFKIFWVNDTVISYEEQLKNVIKNKELRMNMSVFNQKIAWKKYSMTISENLIFKEINKILN